MAENNESDQAEDQSVTSSNWQELFGIEVPNYDAIDDQLSEVDTVDSQFPEALSVIPDITNNLPQVVDTEQIPNNVAISATDCIPIVPLSGEIVDTELIPNNVAVSATDGIPIIPSSGIDDQDEVLHPIDNQNEVLYPPIHEQVRELQSTLSDIISNVLQLIVTEQILDNITIANTNQQAQVVPSSAASVDNVGSHHHDATSVVTDIYNIILQTINTNQVPNNVPASAANDQLQVVPPLPAISEEHIISHMLQVAFIVLHYMNSLLQMIGLDQIPILPLLQMFGMEQMPIFPQFPFNDQLQVEPSSPIFNHIYNHVEELQHVVLDFINNLAHLINTGQIPNNIPMPIFPQLAIDDQLQIVPSSAVFDHVDNQIQQVSSTVPDIVSSPPQMVDIEQIPNDVSQLQEVPSSTIPGILSSLQQELDIGQLPILLIPVSDANNQMHEMLNSVNTPVHGFTLQDIVIRPPQGVPSSFPDTVDSELQGMPSTGMSTPNDNLLVPSTAANQLQEGSSSDATMSGAADSFQGVATSQSQGSSSDTATTDSEDQSQQLPISMESGVISVDGNVVENCCICMNPIPNEDLCILRPCTHYYCHGCFTEWCKQKLSCPLCRTAFTVIQHNITSPTTFLTTKYMDVVKSLGVEPEHLEEAIRALNRSEQSVESIARFIPGMRTIEAELLRLLDSISLEEFLISNVLESNLLGGGAAHSSVSDASNIQHSNHSEGTSNGVSGGQRTSSHEGDEQTPPTSGANFYSASSLVRQAEEARREFYDFFTHIRSTLATHTHDMPYLPSSYTHERAESMSISGNDHNPHGILSPPAYTSQNGGSRIYERNGSGGSRSSRSGVSRYFSRNESLLSNDPLHSRQQNSSDRVSSLRDGQRGSSEYGPNVEGEIGWRVDVPPHSSITPSVPNRHHWHHYAAWGHQQQDVSNYGNSGLYYSNRGVGGGGNNAGNDDWFLPGARRHSQHNEVRHSQHSNIWEGRSQHQPSAHDDSSGPFHCNRSNNAPGYGGVFSALSGRTLSESGDTSERNVGSFRSGNTRGRRNQYGCQRSTHDAPSGHFHHNQSNNEPGYSGGCGAYSGPTGRIEHGERSLFESGNTSELNLGSFQSGNIGGRTNPFAHFEPRAPGNNEMSHRAGDMRMFLPRRQQPGRNSHPRRCNHAHICPSHCTPCPSCPPASRAEEIRRRFQYRKRRHSQCQDSRTQTVERTPSVTHMECNDADCPDEQNEVHTEMITESREVNNEVAADEQHLEVNNHDVNNYPEGGQNEPHIEVTTPSANNHDINNHLEGGQNEPHIEVTTQSANNDDVNNHPEGEQNEPHIEVTTQSAKLDNEVAACTAVMYDDDMQEES